MSENEQKPGVLKTVATVVGVGGGIVSAPIALPLALHAGAGALIGGLGIAAAGAVVNALSGSNDETEPPERKPVTPGSDPVDSE